MDFVTRYQASRIITVIFSVFLAFFPSLLFSQLQDEQGVVRGVVLEIGSSRRVSEVNVTNTRTGKVVPTNLRGEFALEARVGDSLVFSKIGYQTNKTDVRTLSEILIDIRPEAVRLETVDIERRPREEEWRDVMDGYRRQGIYSEGKPSFMRYVFQPITSLYERFSRSGRQARRFQDFVESESQAIAIDRIFNKPRISRLTGLTGEDLYNFAVTYRPAFEHVQFWNEYDVTQYIRDSFRQFEEAGRPEAQKLPRIPIPPQSK